MSAFRAAAVLASLTLVAHPLSGQDLSQAQIGVVPVAAGVSMLTGVGGNIGVSSGQDGTFLIDDQLAPLTDKILAALESIGAGSVHFILNTHFHPDHVGGNENLGKAGALIVAHENVRTRVSVDQFIEALGMAAPALAPGALPVVTFTDAVTFHLNGDQIHVFHVAPAHTDGDAVVHFRKANVVHTGDIYFNGIYPLIDLSGGGDINGTIEAVNRIIAVTNDATKIIPGHGALSTQAELVAYRNMLATVRDRVAAAIAQGKSLDEVIAARPTLEFDAAWGKGLIPPDLFVRVMYQGLSAP